MSACVGVTRVSQLTQVCWHMLQRDHACRGVCRRVPGHARSEGCVPACARTTGSLRACWGALLHARTRRCVCMRVAVRTCTHTRVMACAPMLQGGTRLRAPMHGAGRAYVLQGMHACCRACRRVMACYGMLWRVVACYSVSRHVTVCRGIAAALGSPVPPPQHPWVPPRTCGSGARPQMWWALRQLRGAGDTVGDTDGDTQVVPLPRRPPHPAAPRPRHPPRLGTGETEAGMAAPMGAGVRRGCVPRRVGLCRDVSARGVACFAMTPQPGGGGRERRDVPPPRGWWVVVGDGGSPRALGGLRVPVGVPTADG